MLQSWLQDFRDATRSLVRQPLVIVATALILAFGIGANTAVFSVAGAVLAGSLPYSDLETLAVPVSVNAEIGADRASVTYLDYLAWKESRHPFGSVAVYDLGSVDLSSLSQGEEPRRVSVARVSEDYFRVLGSQPLLGRSFLPEENRPGGGEVILLSEGLWKRMFGGDRGVLGRSVRIDGGAQTVVGVMPDDARWSNAIEIWMPLQFGNEPPDSVMRPDNFRWRSIARLAPDVSWEQAKARLAVQAAAFAKEYPRRAGWGLDLIPLREYLIGKTFRKIVLILLVAAACIVLIISLNVAQILLARNLARDKEIAVRSALGAGRLRLVRLTLAESLVLALVSGAAGLLLATWGVRALLRIAPASVGLQPEQVAVDSRILVFTFGVALLAALLAGMFPALEASRPRLGALLYRMGAERLSWRGHNLRGLLVVAEVALSVVLVAVSLLAARSLARLTAVDPGVRTENLLTFNLSLPTAKYPESSQARAFHQELQHRLARKPGVVAASATSALPLNGGGRYLTRVFVAEGRPTPPAGEDVLAVWLSALPNYFRTTGIPIVQGRDFNERDTAESTPVIIVSEAVARRIFGDENPLGRSIRSWRDENKLREIVGIVGDVRTLDLQDDTPAVYVPFSQSTRSSMMLVVQSTADPLRLLPTVRHEIHSLEPDMAVAEVQTMEEIVGASVADQRFMAVLLGLFAGVALLLSALGLFGLVAFSVGRRHREIGIRMAVGARASDVLRETLWGGLKLSLMGILIGLAMTAMVTRWLTSLLFEIGAVDPVALGASAALLIGVTLLACYLPAHWATQIDPTRALRQE